MLPKGPASRMASLQWEPSECASTWWSDRKESEVEQFEHHEKRWNWRQEGGEEEPIVSGKSRHLWSESLATQQQDLVSMPMDHLTIR